MAALFNVGFCEACEAIAQKWGQNFEHTEYGEGVSTEQDSEQARKAKQERQEILHSLEEVSQASVRELGHRLSENLGEDRICERFEPWFEKWGIGFCTNFAEWAVEKKHIENLVRVGFIKQRDNGSYYTPLVGRLLIPLRDERGQVVGFSGRAMDPMIGSLSMEEVRRKESAPKYVNSPSSEVFQKGELLFGWYEAVPSIRKSGSVVLVEGYTDVMRLHDCGVTTAVARMGTALTEGHLRLFKRADVKHVTLIPDNDAAGFAAIERDLFALLERGFAASVCVLGAEGDDPDTYFAKAPQDDAAGVIEYSSKDALVWWIERKLDGGNQVSELSLGEYRDLFDILGKLFRKLDESTRSYYLTLLGNTFKPRKQWEPLLQNLKGAAVEEDVTLNGRKLVAPDAQKGLSAVQLKEYGITRSDGVLWHLEKNGGVSLISNFTARGLFFIATEGVTHRLIEIENLAGERQYVELSGADKSFKTESDARLFFGKFGNYEYWGSKADTIALWRLLLNECTPCKGISQLGWNDEGFWTWANGVYTPRDGFKEFSEYGTVQIKNRTYYSAAANRINEYSLEHRNRKKFAARFGKYKFTDWQSQFLKVYGSNGRVGLLFMLTSLYRDIIQETAGMVPLLNAFGKCGTGKSVMLRSISRLFFKSPVLMNLANSTLPSLDNAVHEYKNVPIAFDEYSVGITRDKVEFIKSMFDGGGRVKTVASTSVDGLRYNSQSEISASVCIAGQQIPDTDAALLTRIISLEFTKSQYTDSEQDALEDLVAMEQEGLSGVIHECLDARELVESNFSRVYTEMRRLVRKRMSDAGVRTEDRIISTWSILLAIYDILAPVLRISFSKEDILSMASTNITTQTDDLTSGNELTTFWNVFATLVQRGELVRGSDFKLLEASGVQHTESGAVMDVAAGEDLLYLNMTTLYPMYVKEMKAIGGHLFSRVTIQKYLKSGDGFISSKKSVRWDGIKKSQDATPEAVVGKAWVFRLKDIDLPVSFNTEGFGDGDNNNGGNKPPQSPQNNPGGNITPQKDTTSGTTPTNAQKMVTENKQTTAQIQNKSSGVQETPRVPLEKELTKALEQLAAEAFLNTSDSSMSAIYNYVLSRLKKEGWTSEEAEEVLQEFVTENREKYGEAFVPF